MTGAGADDTASEVVEALVAAVAFTEAALDFDTLVVGVNFFNSFARAFNSSRLPDLAAETETKTLPEFKGSLGCLFLSYIHDKIELLF